MKKVMLILIAMLIVSCNKKPMPDPICKAVFRATTGTAEVIASALECKNVGAIAADLSDPFLKMGICEEKAQTTLSEFVCPQLATLAMTLVSSSVPASWDCSVTTINDIIKEKITTTCVKVVK